MSAFLDEFKADIRSRITLVLWLVCAVSLATAGPFGSYGIFTFEQRLLIWLPLSAYAIFCVTLLRSLVFGVWQMRDFPRGALAISVLACVMICPPMHTMAHSLFGSSLVRQPSWAELILLVGSVTLGVCTLRNSLQRTGLVERLPVPVATPLAVPLPRLVERLDPAAQGPLVSISVRDHYVDVVTRQGSGSLLMRFSDAMAEVPVADGTQIHRSHWVAWDAVEAVQKADGKLLVRLATGESFPVSRNHRDKLEARGLI